MFVIYVAGPYRGKDNYVIHQNVAKAEALALEVWKMGNAAAICPHLNTEPPRMRCGSTGTLSLFGVATPCSWCRGMSRPQGRGRRSSSRTSGRSLSSTRFSI